MTGFLRRHLSLLIAFFRYLISRRGDMVEGALTLPLMARLALALVNLSLAGYAAVWANNAANMAARGVRGPDRFRGSGVLAIMIPEI